MSTVIPIDATLIAHHLLEDKLFEEQSVSDPIAPRHKTLPL